MPDIILGNESEDGNDDNYICEFCNVALIEKLDDVAHLGYQYNRLICERCGYIVDTKKEGDTSNVKHAESIRTLTSDSMSNTPYIECIGTTSDSDFEKEDALDSFDSNEVQELRQHGMIIKDVVTITRSSVSGRIKEEHLEE
jgi:hypothetical protein